MADVSVSAADDSEITSASSMYAEVSPTNDAGNGILNTWVGSVLDDYKYTSNSGTQHAGLRRPRPCRGRHYTTNFEVPELDGGTMIGVPGDG